MGRGRTKLSAFDNALIKCGVANYNLIALSSIVPLGAEVTRESRPQTPHEFGDRLYVVKSDIRSDNPGKILIAGIGWYLLPNGGFFVEFADQGSDRKSLEDKMKQNVEHSLEDLCVSRNLPFDKSKVDFEIVAGVVEGGAACALTLAVVRSEPW